MISTRSLRSLRSKADKQAKLAAKTNSEADHRLLFYYLADLRAAEEAANTEQPTATTTAPTPLPASNQTAGFTGPLFDILSLMMADPETQSFLVLIIGLIAQLWSNDMVFLAGLSIILLYFRQHVKTQVLSIFTLLKQQQQRQQQPLSLRQTATNVSDASEAWSNVFETLGIIFGMIAILCSLPFMFMFLGGAAFFITMFPMMGTRAGFLTFEMSIFYLHYCFPLDKLVRSPFRMLASFWLLAYTFLFFCSAAFLISEDPLIGSLAVFWVMAMATPIFSMLNDQKKKSQDVSTIAEN